MRRLLAFVVALAAALFVVGGCTLPAADQPYGYAQVSDVPAATCSRSYAVTMNASEFTDPTEQAQLTQAADEWRAFSGGRVDITISFDPQTSASHMIHRDAPTDAVITSEEAKSDLTFVFGFATSGPTVYLVPSEVPPLSLHTLAAHELGHVAGLAWPLCLESPSKCVHSPDPAAVMFASFSNAPKFTPSDLALCRASCLCP